MPLSTLPLDPPRQCTIARPRSISGVGVHSGRPAMLTLHPAPTDTGVVFERTDLPAAAASIPASWQSVIDTRLCTVLGNAHGATVSTVEHLLAALAAAGVDNVRVQLDGPEVPILDGSAAEWMVLIAEAGVVPQQRERRRIEVLKPVRIGDDEKWAMLVPGRGSRYSVQIDFAEPLIGCQQFHFRLEAAAFARDIAPARTFGFAAEVGAMQAAGRALGGSLDNAVVIGDGRVLNPDGLRFGDEFVRHKLLDCVGDLYLAGAPIEGRLIAHRPGHALNVELLRALFAQADAWQWSQRVVRQAQPLACAA